MRKLKSLLLSIGLFSLTALSLLWFVRTVPLIQYKDIEKTESQANIVEDNSFPLADNDEVALGDAIEEALTLDSYCTEYGYNYYQTSKKTGCKSVEKNSGSSNSVTYGSNDNFHSGVSSSSSSSSAGFKESGCNSSWSSCYKCYECTSSSSSYDISSSSSTSGTWKMIKEDLELDLEYKANCSISPSDNSASCTIATSSSNSYTHKITEDDLGKTLKYSITGSTTNRSATTSSKTPSLQILTCPDPKWSVGAYTALINDDASANSQLNAVYNAKDIYRGACRKYKCADYKCDKVYTWICPAGQWHYRCGATTNSVCLYEVSGYGDDGFKYANWYEYTKDVSLLLNAPAGKTIGVNSNDASKCKGCYGTKPTLANSEKVNWQSGPTSEYPYKLDEQDSAEKCQAIKKPQVCKPEEKDGTPKVEVKTEKCEEEKSIFYTDGKWCGDSGVAESTEEGKVALAAYYTTDSKPFFENKCVTRISNKFDLEGEDIEVGETLDIKQGQSIGYEMRSTSSKLCYAKFNMSTWLEAYNLVQKKLTTKESVRANDASDAKERIEPVRNWYKNVLKAILNQLNEYMEWSPKHKNEPESEIKLLNGTSVSQGLNNPKGSSDNTTVKLEIKKCRNNEDGMEDPDDPEKCIPRCKFDGSDPDACVPKLVKYATDTPGIEVMYRQYKDDIEKGEIKEGSDERETLIKVEDYGVNYNGKEENQPDFSRVDLSKGAYVLEVWDKPIDVKGIKNFLWFTTMKDVTTLIPQSVDLDWTNGSILATGSTPVKTVDGYNRIYTDDNITKGEKYQFDINVTKIGTNESTISNKMCKVNVVDREVTYRVIEESNPFINESRKKGYNWYRTGADGILYDFTQVIPNSVGYSAFYEFNSYAIDLVKQSNASSKDSYLGSCYLKKETVASSVLCNN